MARPRKSLADKVWLKWEYLRKANGYELDEWCLKLGVSRQTWHRYSSDASNVTLSTLREISRLTHTPIDEVVA